MGGVTTSHGGKQFARYDVEADWQLLNTCNFRCSYCFFDDRFLGQELKTFASPRRWADAFEQTGLTWLIHISGGEPSAYPQFCELCANLTARHFISLNSNMTHRSWETFARTIDPDRVSFINAGLHLSERERRGGAASFLRNVDLVREAGFRTVVSVVATPEALERFEEAIDLLRPIELYPIPKIYRGAQDGRIYPQAYTARERRLFRTFNAEAKRFYSSPREQERPSIDLLKDDEMLHGTPDYTGLSCDAGKRFFKVETNGDVYRCGHSQAFGNLLDGTFFRNRSATPCDTSHCYYFCQKYSAEPPAVRRLRHKVSATVREFGQFAFR